MIGIRASGYRTDGSKIITGAPSFQFKQLYLLRKINFPVQYIAGLFFIAVKFNQANGQYGKAADAAGSVAIARTCQKV